MTAQTAPTISNNGVYFSNSHSLFPTFTMANASAIATGHQLGDTGDFSNTIASGFPVYNTGNFGLLPGLRRRSSRTTRSSAISTTTSTAACSTRRR